MKILKTYNSPDHGQVNRMDIGYSVPAPTLSQQHLMLKNLLLSFGHSLRGVSWLALPEKLINNGPDTAKRVAQHLIAHAIPFPVAGELLKGLVEVGKLNMSPDHQALALAMLADRCADLSGSYNTTAR